MVPSEIVIRVDRKAFIAAAAVVLISAAAVRLWSESLTLVTTYPSPSGIYNQIVTTGNSGATPADTTLNRNAGNAILVPASNLNGKVGIGTTAPSRMLDIAADGNARNYLGLIDTGSGGHAYVIRNGASGNNGTLDLSDITAGAVRLAITAVGNVGIGTIAPLSRLDVGGGVAIGSYAGTQAALPNGLIVSGNVGIGSAVQVATPYPTPLHVFTPIDNNNIAYFETNQNLGRITVKAAGSQWDLIAGVLSGAGGNQFTIYNPNNTGGNPFPFSIAGNGNVTIPGNLTKGGGAFEIDHPLDPKNRILRHSFVESPEMKNIYDGIAAIDDKGEAQVRLPDYFEALNKDFRYQLTPVGSPAPSLHIKKGIQEGRFVIAGGQSGQKVSWQVTGVRRDAYALKHPIIMEEEKGAGNSHKKGGYLHPDAFASPRDK